MFTKKSVVYLNMAEAMNKKAREAGKLKLYDDMFNASWSWTYPDNKPMEFGEFAKHTLRKSEVPEWASVECIILYFDETLKATYQDYLSEWEERIAEREHPEE